MTRLIDADAIRLPKGFFEAVDDAPKFYDWLNKLPTVDAEPVRHGRWARLDTPVGEPDFKCTVCNIRVHVPTCMGEPMYEYCPVCGAVMDLQEDDDAEKDLR